ncbi:MAG TPA: hypothetical protein VGF64_06290 [Acidimicrobiales bacterium]|jgi:hypothetical protein
MDNDTSAEVEKDTSGRDDQVLELRNAGQSFAAIAKTVGYGRASETREAFNRALRRRPVEVRDALRLQEMVRLDAMAEVFRNSPKLDEEEIAQRLRAVDQLRTRLMAD